MHERTPDPVLRGLRGSRAKARRILDANRRLPEDGEIRWLIAQINQEGQLLASLIEDLSPRIQCVLGGPCAEHPNGVIGIRRLEVGMPDAEGAVQTFATLTASPGGAGTSITLGPCALSLVRPEQEDERRDTASTPRGPACFGGACDQLTRVSGSWTGGSHTGSAPALGAGCWRLKPSLPARDNTVAATGVAIGGSPQ